MTEPVWFAPVSPMLTDTLTERFVLPAFTDKCKPDRVSTRLPPNKSDRPAHDALKKDRTEH